MIQVSQIAEKPEQEVDVGKGRGQKTGRHAAAQSQTVIFKTILLAVRPCGEHATQGVGHGINFIYPPAQTHCSAIISGNQN